MIYIECGGVPRKFSENHYQTVRILDVKRMSQKDWEKAVSACLRSERKDIYVDKELALSHFLEK